MDRESDEVSSSDNDTESDETDEIPKVVREKRSVAQKGANQRPHLVWPPPCSSERTFNWRNLRKVRPGNPHLGNKMQLYSRTRHFLAIYSNGRVRGTRDENDPHTHLEIISAHMPGHVKVRGIQTGLFVAMDSKGRLYAQPDAMEEASVFIEDFQGSYNTYLSRKYAHLGWYLGIKKSGRFKKGPKTAFGQKAISFLPVRTKFE